MKRLLFICLFVFAATGVFAQATTDVDQIRLEKDKDFARADSAVLQSANYLLSSPVDQDITRRQKESHFVIKWMEGTPDYTFYVDQNLIKYFSENVDIMVMYMTSMAQFALQHKATDSTAIALNGAKILLHYIDNSANGIKKDKLLKKLSDANDAGKLRELFSFQ